jgi:hypothetical protein
MSLGSGSGQEHGRSIPFSDLARYSIDIRKARADIKSLLSVSLGTT